MTQGGALPRWFSFALIVVFALVGYGFLLAPDQVLYSPHSDILAYHLGAKEILWRSLEAGRGVPFWRGDQLAGGPAFTSPNALYTYPLHAVFYLRPPAAAVGWTILFHLVLGGCVYYVVGRGLGLTRLSSSFIAVAALFHFKLIMAVYAGWLSVLPSIVLFPLLFAAVTWLVAEPGPLRMLVAGTVGALCLHAGQLQLVYYALWFVAGYTAVTLGARWRGGRRADAARAAAWLGGAGLLSFGLAAYLLLPFLAELHLVTRTAASEEFFRGGRGVQISHLLTFFFPEVLGTPLDESYPGVELWEDVAYFGLIPFCLAVLGVVSGWKRRFTVPLAGGFVLSLLFALDTPLLGLPYNFLPGFHWYRLPGRLLFLTAFFGLTLSGVGLDALVTRLREAGWGAWRCRLLTGILILIVAGEGVTYVRRYLTTIHRSQATPATDYAALLANDSGPFRVAPIGRYTVNYGWAAELGLQMITGYEPYNLRHYQQYVALMRTGRTRQADAVVWTDLVGVARWDLLDRLNVRYLLSPVPIQLPGDRLELVAELRDQPAFVFYQGMTRTTIRVYRNRGALSRVFWAQRLVPASDEAEAVSAIERVTLDGSAIVEGIRESSEVPAVSANERAVVVDSTDGHLTVDVDTRTERFLVVSEIWHPGWRAFLDGAPMAVYRTDLALMGVRVPPGRHKLALEFRPVCWSVALGLSVLAATVLIAWLGLLAVNWWRAHGSRAG